jgi:hypothetical protein
LGESRGCVSDWPLICLISVSRSLPALRWPSIQSQSSSGNAESRALNGTGDTLAQSLKKMLRCMCMLFGIEVHS